MATVVDSLQSRPPISNRERADANARMWDRLTNRLGNWLGRDAHGHGSHRAASESCNGRGQSGSSDKVKRSSRWSVVPELPRAPTFRRQQSEKREHLMPHEPCSVERRAVSADRRTSRSQRAFSPQTPAPPSLSAPDVRPVESTVNRLRGEKEELSTAEVVEVPDLEERHGEMPPSFRALDDRSESGVLSDAVIEEILDEELEKRWILNLSMHFRDRSDREKFFVTFAETPTLWRRLTVSCDYRDAHPDSLEHDLKVQRYQRDKSARIYESIRESLPDIQFHNTVTNLKLQTSEGRLHVHVTEDVNEIITYPSVAAIAHLTCPRYRESALEFDSHLSGFVYKVFIEGRVYIKKEIPGPESVDEFLYEINALHCLCDSSNVIPFGGVIVDEDERLVKGLLISFAEQGALVDILFEEKGRLPWERRERWAKQIVTGLSEIHEGGFVQGDFTLSNIVIDNNDDAKIIDINRRGCPVGWEPPEVAALIESSQRISMYIGVKSDLFQLGMVLWALAEEQDEPERQPRPLSLDKAGDHVPEYYRTLVSGCISDRPQARLSAKDLLTRFPDADDPTSRVPTAPKKTVSNLSETQYIDPADAVELEDIRRFRQMSPQALGVQDCADGVVLGDGTTYVGATQSSDTGYGSSITRVVQRGRTGVHRPVEDGEQSPRDTKSEDSDLQPQIVSVSPTQERRWEDVDLKGQPYLVSGAPSAPEDSELKEISLSDRAVLPHVSTTVTEGLLPGDLAGVGAHVDAPHQIGLVDDRKPSEAPQDC
ncbi:MAG: hypothetical protein M1833_004617 [Piccolia ochrophora]|nr:MAG: hypothetical protein M1833_004617 [Piccolia ochrophora]